MRSIAKYFPSQFELKHGQRRRDPFQSLSGINQLSGGLCVSREGCQNPSQEEERNVCTKGHLRTVKINAVCNDLKRLPGRRGVNSLF